MTAQRIEFNRVHRVKSHRGCFLLRKTESIRYKFAGASVPGDRNNKKHTFKPTANAMPLSTKHEDDKHLRSAPTISQHKKTIKNHQPPSTKPKDISKANSFNERIDLYYFDHGNAAFFCTTDCQPQLHTDRLARETADTANRFWAEIYGSIHIVIAILVAFVLQTLRFLLYSIVRPLLVGSVQLCGDYVIKPMLTAGFNACIQPPLMCIRNVLQSVEHMLRPVCTMLRNAVEPLALVAGALRLVEINNYHYCAAMGMTDIENAAGGSNDVDGNEGRANVSPNIRETTTKLLQDV